MNKSTDYDEYQWRVFFSSVTLEGLAKGFSPLLQTQLKAQRALGHYGLLHARCRSLQSQRWTQRELRKLSVCKGWKTIFFPKVYTLKFNNRHGRKNSKSSGEDGQVAHSVYSRSIQSSRRRMGNKYAVHGSLSVKKKKQKKNHLIISNVRSLSNLRRGRCGGS